MTSELDNFLNSLDEQSKQKEQAERELRRKQNLFITAFKECLDKIIHPAMIKILDNLRKRDYYGVVLSARRKQSNSLEHLKGYDEPPKQMAGEILYNHYENYYISAQKIAKGIYLILTVLGNYSIQKVCVFTEYLETVTEQKDMAEVKTVSVKKTEEQYALSEINPDLFEKIVLEKLQEMLAIKQ